MKHLLLGLFCGFCYIPSAFAEEQDASNTETPQVDQDSSSASPPCMVRARYLSASCSERGSQWSCTVDEICPSPCSFAKRDWVMSDPGRLSIVADTLFLAQHDKWGRHSPF